MAAAAASVVLEFPPTPELVRDAAARLGRALTPAQAEGLAIYLDDLLRWGRLTNLVGPKDWPTILADLAADAWRLADLLATLDLSEDCLTLDLGAGAGMPGVPLRLFWTAGRYVMVEERTKRVHFVRAALARLTAAGLAAPRTVVEKANAENPPRTLFGPEAGADLVVARAFRPWQEYLAIAGPLLVSGGRAVVMASAPPPVEVGEPLAPGFRLERAQSYPVFSVDGAPGAPKGERWLWVALRSPA